MDFKMPDFSKLATSISNIVPPPMPSIMPDYKTVRITSAIENLKHNSLLNELDNLEYNIKLKKVERKNCDDRLNGIKSSSDIFWGIIISIIVALISIIIPFIIVAFNNYLSENQNIIFWYMISSFIISMLLLLGYLIYSYKNNKLGGNILP